MIERLRFHLDEQVNIRVAAALRQHGCDVTTTNDAGLRTTTDRIQLDYARQTGRVLITHDTDFLRIASESSDHPGILYCAQHARSIGEIVRAVMRHYEDKEASEMVGQVYYL